MGCVANPYLIDNTWCPFLLILCATDCAHNGQTLKPFPLYDYFLWQWKLKRIWLIPINGSELIAHETAFHSALREKKFKPTHMWRIFIGQKSILKNNDQIFSCSNEMDLHCWVRGEMAYIYCQGDKGLRENTMTRKMTLNWKNGHLHGSFGRKHLQFLKNKEIIHGARKRFSEMESLVFLPCPEGLLQRGSASIVSMHTRFYTHCVFMCRWKTAYCALKWIWICLYNAGLLRGAAFNECFIVLNNVIFFGLFKFNIDAASRDVFKDKVGRCLNDKVRLASSRDSLSKIKTWNKAHHQEL